MTTQDNQPKRIGHYLIQKTLGQGTFGKVKLAIHQKTSQKVAIKILQKKKIVDVSDIERVSRQIHILKLVRHPHLIQLYEIIQTPKYLFLVMEYCGGGQLFDYIAQQKQLTQRQSCRFFHQIIDGVDYLHKLGIVHRDLKPQNMLLDKDKNIKIVDFGLSNTYSEIIVKNKQQEKQKENGAIVIEDGEEPDGQNKSEKVKQQKQDYSKKQELKTACGSPCYAAPEMIAGKRYNGLQVDLWSCGVILYAMICGTLPFQDPNTSLLYKKILTLNYKIPGDISSFAKDILKNMLTSNTKRISLSQIRSHEFYKLYNHMQAEGIIVGKHTIPIDQNILNETNKLGYDPQYTRQCLLTNKHNAQTTAYYLILKQRHQNGFQSIADINSNRFDSSLLSYHGEEQIKKVARNQQQLQENVKNRLSYDKFLQAELLQEFGYQTQNQKIRKSNNDKRNDNTNNSSKRYSVFHEVVNRTHKSRSKFTSRLQQSYQQNYSASKQKQTNKSYERQRDREDNKNKIIFNLPTLNKKNKRYI